MTFGAGNIDRNRLRCIASAYCPYGKRTESNEQKRLLLIDDLAFGLINFVQRHATF